MRNGGAVLPAAADLYNDLTEPAEIPALRRLLPGLAVAILATLAAAYLSEHYGAPLTLMSLLVGLALNFLGRDAALRPGLGFASRTLLRYGIVLVGLKVTIGQVVDLGPAVLAWLVLLVASTLGAGALLGRLFGLGTALGTLAGGAVAICGASAAMALGALLGERRINGAQLAMVLVAVAGASAFAMVAYPAVAHLLAFDDRQTGFMVGGAIHDVAQALGAGYSISEEAGETAAIVKLTRVALLAPALALLGWCYPRQDGGSRAIIAVPWFVVGFFVVAAMNTASLIPPAIVAPASRLAEMSLAAAIVATGVQAPMSQLVGQGMKPLSIVALCSVLSLAIAALGAALLL